MAISSTFKERLDQMEDTRNQRLSLLQAEKQLQLNKSQTLASKLSCIRLIEQRCLKLDQKVTSQKFVISSLKSQLDRTQSIYTAQMQQHRVLKGEVEELEDLEKEKDKYFASKARDIDEFRVRAEIFAAECQRRAEELRNCVNEGKSQPQSETEAGVFDNLFLPPLNLNFGPFQKDEKPSPFAARGPYSFSTTMSAKISEGFNICN